MKNRMSMLALALVAAIVLVPGAARAADEVQLSHAELRQLCSSCGQVEGSVEVKNLAYEKQLAVVYSFGDGVWHEANAGYSGPAANGFERWSFSVTSPYGATVRFALRYRVAGQEYWDNNGGADYLIGGTAPGFLLGRAAVKLDTAGFYSSRAGYYVTGSVMVKNLAYAKEVKVVHTWDDWATTQEAFASYDSEVALSGGATERWNFILPVPAPGSQRGRFAIAYTVNGVTYWDNNGGANYSLAWGEVIN